MERLSWEVERYGLLELVRRSNEDHTPVPAEELDAQEAEDAAILADRAAKAAADVLERNLRTTLARSRPPARRARRPTKRRAPPSKHDAWPKRPREPRA